MLAQAAWELTPSAALLVISLAFMFLTGNGKSKPDIYG